MPLQASVRNFGAHANPRPPQPDDILDVLADAAVDETPPLDMLLADVKNLQREKWDWALPDQLLRKAYASLYLNLDEALAWVRGLPSE